MNNVNLVGRLTKDVEVRKSQSGLSVARFNLAINRIKSKDSDKVEADFIPCVAFGKTAEFMEAYIKKGFLVSIEGKLQSGMYEKDGKKNYTLEVFVNSLQNLTPRDKESKEEVKEEYMEIKDDDLPF